MRALGRKGGLVSRSDRVPEDLALELRTQAREELLRLLESDDERVRLAAARSIDAFSPQRPPEIKGETARAKIAFTAEIPTFGDVIQVALDCGALRVAGMARSRWVAACCVLRPLPPSGKLARRPRKRWLFVGGKLSATLR